MIFAADLTASIFCTSTAESAIVAIRCENKGRYRFGFVHQFPHDDEERIIVERDLLPVLENERIVDLSIRSDFTFGSAGVGNVVECRGEYARVVVEEEELGIEVVQSNEAVGVAFLCKHRRNLSSLSPAESASTYASHGPFW